VGGGTVFVVVLKRDFVVDAEIGLWERIDFLFNNFFLVHLERKTKNL
jgi:hypothetical protein